MTANNASPPPPEEATTVVVDLGGPPYDAPALELRGPLDPARLEAALDHLAVRDPDAPAWRHRIDRLGRDHHTLRLAADDASTPGDVFPYGLLADLLTHPVPGIHTARGLAPTPLQRELLADADAHPGRHVEQLTWAWHGPLDIERFHAAWQSVVDHESVLRTAFDDGPEHLLVLHDHTAADILWLPHGAARWADVLEHDRRRGIDPRRPGALRVTVLGGGRPGEARTEPARVLLTYHHALLDDWSARLLLREFYRAYLAGGRLPGGERRPDIRDYARWLRRQDTAPARDYWSRAVLPRPAAACPPPPAAPGPARPADTVGGRTRLSLTAAQTERLSAWAAQLGSTESGALQAVWALLLYRARGAEGAAPVRFSVTASGRGILFEGVHRMPAALRTALPLSVVVDPRSTVATLLADLRDRALDLSAYEWVSPGQTRSWAAPEHSGTDRPDSSTGTEDGTLLSFESPPRDPDDLTAALAARGIRVERPETLGARTAFPLTLVAHHDGDERLVLTASYDRSRIADAADVLTHSALLLGELPYLAGDSTTVADLLRLLSTAVDQGDGALAAAAAVPPPATGTGPDGDRADTRPEPETESPVVLLRAAADIGAGTVCLVQSHDIPRSRYELLAGAYQGPESVILLRAVPGGTHARYTALQPLADAGRLLVLGGFSGGGSAAYEIARRVAAGGGRPPLVVLTAATAGTDGLARTLETAAAQVGHPGHTG